jgi:cytochrome c oxidase cbb3-type subunit I/II
MWHYQHLVDPRAITAGSNMPPYAHLSDEKIDLATTSAKMKAMRTVGVPYTDAQIAGAADDARAQGQLVTKDLAEGGVHLDPESKMVATIAYLQRLGQKPQPNKPHEVAHAP